MDEHPYARFGRLTLDLRDQLAIDRTLLANERTLLAYLRAGVALLIAGVTIIHFADRSWFLGVGIACLPTGLVCGIVGVMRYARMDRAIRVIREKREEAGRED